MIMLLAQTPVPRDVPLPLPAMGWLLKAVLVAVFLLHILFVNLMLGGTTLTAWFEIIGRRKPRYDGLAQAIGATITVNKSLAVVLGVGPLLAINVLYTVHFYSANAITGEAWISVVPLVIVAFLLTYLHKYAWRAMSGMKSLHIAVVVAAAAIFWFIPLIFLANINLMLFPEHWRETGGFGESIVLDNVWPRYLHFMLASLALTGLFLAWWMGRPGFDAERSTPGFTRPQLRRMFCFFALIVTAGQLVVGPLVYFTLPWQGVTMGVTVMAFGGAAVAIAAMWPLWRAWHGGEAEIGRRLLHAAALLGVVVLCMGTGRHLYRDGALAEHESQVTAATIEFERKVRLAGARAEQQAAILGDKPIGQALFESTCSLCHAVDKVRTGPSVREIAERYAGDPEGIVTWTRNPGRKREDFPQMPAFKLDRTKLREVAKHMLELGAEDE